MGADEEKEAHPQAQGGASMSALTAGETLEKAVDVLDACARDLSLIGGCTLTDRPDLPLTPVTSWKLDVAQRLADIEAAKVALKSVLQSSCHECGGCSSRLPMPQNTSLAKCAQARCSSHSHDGGCL